jgi:hypothetical protein
MTLKEYLMWFRENWQKVGVLVALFLTTYLVVIVLPKSTILFALLMSTPLYILHEIEEYVFPGGFAQFLNKNIYKTDPETGLLDTTAIFWINMVVWIALPFYSLLAVADLSQAAWIPYFFIFQACVHLILGIVGKRFVNPGMVSAWLVHVPWGMWTIWLLLQAGVITDPFWNADLLSGLLINAALLFVGYFLLARYRRKQQYGHQA